MEIGGETWMENLVNVNLKLLMAYLKTKLWREWIDRMKILTTRQNIFNIPEKGIVIYLKLYAPLFHYPHIMIINKYW